MPRYRVAAGSRPNGASAADPAPGSRAGKGRPPAPRSRLAQCRETPAGAWPGAATDLWACSISYPQVNPEDPECFVSSAGGGLSSHSSPKSDQMRSTRVCTTTFHPGMPSIGAAAGSKEAMIKPRSSKVLCRRMISIMDTRLARASISPCHNQESLEGVPHAADGVAAIGDPAMAYRRLALARHLGGAKSSLSPGPPCGRARAPSRPDRGDPPAREGPRRKRAVCLGENAWKRDG